MEGFIYLIIIIIMVLTIYLCIVLGVDRNKDNRSKRIENAKQEHKESLESGIGFSEFGQLFGIKYKGMIIDKDGNQTHGEQKL